jgi:hypothetical protein
LSPDEIGKPGLGLPAGVSVNEVNHMVGRIDEHHRPRQYIPQAKLAEALRAAARLRGERFHPDFVPPKAIRPATPIKWRRLNVCGGIAAAAILRRNDCGKLIRNFLFAI